MTKGTILIVDEDRQNLNYLASTAKKEFEKVIILPGPKRLHEILYRDEVDIAVLDMNFRSGVHNGNEGLFWMKEIFKHDSNVSVIIITASGDIDLAVRAI